eukprot:5659687-Amphidinium_carterae.1
MNTAGSKNPSCCTSLWGRLALKLPWILLTTRMTSPSKLATCCNQRRNPTTQTRPNARQNQSVPNEATV